MIAVVGGVIPVPGSGKGVYGFVELDVGTTGNPLVGLVGMYHPLPTHLDLMLVVRFPFLRSL